MFLESFASFSVKSLEKAKEFYTQILDLELASEKMGLTLNLPGGGQVHLYQKDNHQPATFTVLNFVVEDIDAAVKELQGKGITFEQYNDSHMPQDEQGICRGIAANRGPDIAWFKDSDGNILSVLQKE